MEKRDLRKELKHLYEPPAGRVVTVEVPTMQYLMLDGAGDPNASPAYQAAVEALYSLSYAIKFAAKKGAAAIDYGVMPLEGLWWAEDATVFATGDKSLWRWTMMIMQPEFVTPAMVADATEAQRQKVAPPVLGAVRFEAFAEGLCAQTLHVGPFSDEEPTVARVHRFIADAGGQPAGKHHEIYLSDIRRTDPLRWRTVIRQPMR